MNESVSRGRQAGKHVYRRRMSVLAALVLTILSLLSACTGAQTIGPRPADDVLDAVEVYLQRHQPGPLPRVFQTTRIFDRHGTLLAERWNEGRRTWLPLSTISPHLIEATIATEDATFYQNRGVDPARIAGAFLQNAQEQQIVSGASTITMQLARNIFLGPEERYDQTMDRKLQEAGLADELNNLFSKDEILEMYLNLLNYGHLTYGPEAAAQVYFGKPALALSLAEATLMAGIPQQPADLDLFYNLDAAKRRQRVVLDMMVRHGYLTEAESDAVYAEKVVLNEQPDARVSRAPHFVQYLEEWLDAKLGVGATARSGLTIVTTLDMSLQKEAQKIVANQVKKLKPSFDLNNAALVAMTPGSNEILVMVGSAGFDNAEIDGQVNVATSLRQPGSAIKPVLYAAAIDDNLVSPATVLWDTPISYEVGVDQEYKPVNYDGEFHGPVTVRTALANSYNIPAVKLLDAVGVERMLEVAQKMGIRSLDRGKDWYGLSLTLGGGDVTLLDLTTAYATLANQGVYIEPTPIREINRPNGRQLVLLPDKPPDQVISQATSFLLSDMLSDNEARRAEFGEQNPLKFKFPVAAKTGTTDDWRDNWTVGYSPDLVAGVWAGNSDGHPMKNTSGLTGAAPIWKNFMKTALADRDRATGFEQPLDVIQEDVCPPGLKCRQDGEYFSAAWLAATADAGPISDSVQTTASAPVYLDSGAGPQFAGFCEWEQAVERRVLVLPGALGPPHPPSEALENNEGNESEAAAENDGTATEEDGEPPHPRSLDQLGAVKWSLKHQTAVNLGPCNGLESLAKDLEGLEDGSGLVTGQIYVDLAAAMDANVDPKAATQLTSIAFLAPAQGNYRPAKDAVHHQNCPGNYIVGRTLNSAGAPVAGIQILLIDEWGNQAIAVSKSGASDYGNYDFPINHFPNRYTLTVIDNYGYPLGAPKLVEHLQGSGGDSPCHTVDWVVVGG